MPIGALDGVRILDFASVGPGARASRMLSDYGAEVIHVVSPAGDILRNQPAYYFWQRGKKSITLDLKNAEARANARKLALSVDILIEAYRR